MLAKLMRVFEYDETGWNCRKSNIINPTWNDIEAAVRRLDKFRFPFLWFFYSERVDTYAAADFEVVGGDGEFVVAGSIEGYTQRRLRFPHHPKRIIQIWLSDQGCEMDDEFVCWDVDEVLKALHSFAFEGKFSPDFQWENP
jgi:hypothetical protein